MKRIEKIRTGERRAKESAANLSETVREARLGWLRQIERKTGEAVVMGTWKMAQ